MKHCIYLSQEQTDFRLEDVFWDCALHNKSLLKYEAVRSICSTTLSCRSTKEGPTIENYMLINHTWQGSEELERNIGIRSSLVSLTYSSLFIYTKKLFIQKNVNVKYEGFPFVAYSLRVKITIFGHFKICVMHRILT